jgi:metallo-beta-lactamase family protein
MGPRPFSRGWRTIRARALAVRATVVELPGFSAHADRSELLRRLGTLENKPHLHAVHGEPASSAAFVTLVKEALGFAASLGERGSPVPL